MPSLDHFLEDLKAFFKDANHFLTDTVEGYSMSDVDDKERDSLVEAIIKLTAMMSSFTTGPEPPLPPPPDEIYDDNVEPNNNQDSYFQPVAQPEVEEYLAPNEEKKSVQNFKATITKEPDGTITEDTYEDPYSGNKPPVPEKDEGIMEETYEDPYADRDKPTAPGNTEEEGGIMEDMYEDPYADGKRKDPPSQSKKEEDDVIIEEDTYDNPDELKKAKEQEEKEKKGKKKDKKKEEKKHKKSVSDNKSEGGSSEEINVKQIPASELKDAEFQGILKKHKDKRPLLVKHTRWCAVRDNYFYYFESEKSKQQKGAISLKSYEASAVADEVAKKRYVFQLTCPGRKSYYFTTSQEKDMKQWIHYINKGEILTEEVQEVDDNEETYEDTEEVSTETGGNKQEVSKEEDDGIMDDIYEETDYETKKFGNNVKPNQPMSRKDEPQPPVPSARDGPPPPVPAVRKDKPGPEEIYDDTVLESDDLYTDGTSAPPEPTPLKKDPQPCTLRPKPPIPPETLPPPPPSPTPEPPEVKYDAMYYGLWPCQNVGDEELEFVRGACIEILNKDQYDKDGWWVGKLGSKVGLVPKTYLMPMYVEV